MPEVKRPLNHHAPRARVTGALWAAAVVAVGGWLWSIFGNPYTGASVVPGGLVLLAAAIA